MGAILTRGHLESTGWSSGAISRAVAGGELEWLASGMYTVPDDSKPWVKYLLRVRAASVNRIHVVSHESAVALHDIPFLHPERTCVHFTTGLDHGGDIRGGKAGKVHLHPRPLLPEDITVMDGILVTSRARTAVDIAMCADLIRGVCAVDSVRLVRRYPKPEDPEPVGEFEGKDKYGETAEERAAALEAEKEREAEFTDSGIEVLRWNWNHLKQTGKLHALLLPAMARHGLIVPPHTM